LLTLVVFFLFTGILWFFRLCDGGREKKRPRKDVGSGRHPVFYGDDPMDSDYDAKEEIGSKKIVPHKARSKSASNAPPRRQPAAPWRQPLLSPLSSSS
jgi:hypothetical protein